MQRTFQVEKFRGEKVQSTKNNKKPPEYFKHYFRCYVVPNIYSSNETSSTTVCKYLEVTVKTQVNNMCRKKCKSKNKTSLRRNISCRLNF